MNIKSISVNNIKCSPIKPQSFKGVWGKSSQVSDIEPAMNIPLIKKYYYYYPFKDESEDQINKVLQENSDAKIIHDPDDKYVIKEARRTLRTSYTEDEYNKYKALTSTSNMDARMRSIHGAVQHMFSTSGFDDTPQKPAANSKLN